MAGEAGAIPIGDGRKRPGTGRPASRRGASRLPRPGTDADRASRAVAAFLGSCREALGAGTEASFLRHASTSSGLIEAISRLKGAPKVAGAMEPDGTPWPHKVARKGGVIYLIFADPDGDGEHLVPFLEAEIVDLD